MSSILAGLFEKQSDYKKLEQELEAFGIPNSKYIVYLNKDHENSQYMVSVEINDKSIIDNIKKIFTDNHGFKTYFFENMTIEEATYEFVKKLIDIRAKSEIHNSPDVRIKGQHDGMTSEVKV